MSWGARFAALVALGCLSAPAGLAARPVQGPLSSLVYPPVRATATPPGFVHAPPLAEGPAAHGTLSCRGCHPGEARPARWSAATCVPCHPAAASGAQGEAPSASPLVPGAGPVAAPAPPGPPRPLAGRVPRAWELLPPVLPPQRAGTPPLEELERSPAVSLLGSPALRFTHARHAQEDCGACHRPELPGDRPLPSMQRCRACHEQRGAGLACAGCHATLPDGRLRSRFAVRHWPEWGPGPAPLLGLRRWPGASDEEALLRPSGSLVGAAHDLSWGRSHGPVARSQGPFCSECHAPEQCQGCHQGSVRPLGLHPAGWLLEHAGLAQRQPERCQACHRLERSCLACHQRVGLVAPGEAGPRPPSAASRMHPAGWASLDPAAAQGHAQAARRSLASCVACHSGDLCASCHRSRDLGGGGFSPHPAGFAGRCRSLLQANPTACRACHGETLSASAACR